MLKLMFGTRGMIPIAIGTFVCNIQKFMGVLPIAIGSN